MHAAEHTKVFCGVLALEVDSIGVPNLNNWSENPRYWYVYPLLTKFKPRGWRIICTDRTMVQTIPYLRWRERINDITPANYRIGNDVIVIPQHPMLDLPTGCFKFDARR